MSSIVTLPSPPYYAVIAPAVLRHDLAGHGRMADAAMRAASGLDGFHGIEVCAQPGFAMAVSYWRSLEAIDEWRRHRTHEQAKSLGRSRWFDQYATRIAQVIDAY
ncbi:antibiotic biosynthesis monooxygenase family protein [Nonomuraea sp. NPDC050663]|uniref:antibiotic biosynthesis monooxygenase family protein n=1 Tax=Nonomuraea sp. NPDC050663 TaxID=3364370 RepID=UPI003799FDA5